MKVKGWLPKLMLWKTGYVEFVEKHFSDLLGQFIITDVDGYMKGNHLVPNLANIGK